MKSLGLDDVLAVAGLGMLFAGLWWIYPPSALIVVGSIVFMVPIAPAVAALLPGRRER